MIKRSLNQFRFVWLDEPNQESAGRVALCQVFDQYSLVHHILPRKLFCACVIFCTVSFVRYLGRSVASLVCARDYVRPGVQWRE